MDFDIVTVAECRSITKAAEKLHVSQPALSAFISNAESSMGIRLFERLSLEIVSTYSGELYSHAAKQMLLLKSKFDEMLSDLQGDYKERLRIGM